MAVSKKKVSRKKSRRKTAKRKKPSTKKRARKKTPRKKTAAKRPSVKKTAAKKTAVKKAAAEKAPSQTEAQAEIAVTATGVAPSIEDRMAAPMSEIERVVEMFRDRADQLRAIAPFDPFNPMTFNPMTWEMPSWKEIQDLFDVRVPTVDVINQDKNILVVAEVPGVEKDDIVVTVTDRSATIKGARHHETHSEDAEIHRHEIRKGSFSRTITLPEEIDGRKAKATYKAGVVELRLPKRRISKKLKVKLD